MHQWKSFQFFEKELVKEENSTDPHPALAKIVTNCAASGRGSLLLGVFRTATDADGCLHVVDRSFKITSFVAYEQAISHLYLVRDHNVLFSVGSDEEAIVSVIKIWNLDKLDVNGIPTLMNSLRLEQKGLSIPHVPVTGIAAMPDMSQLAVGLCNGAVVGMSGDLLRDRGVRLRLIKPEDGNPVTGLAFRVQGSANLLFVVTTGAVYSYWLHHKDFENVLDGDEGGEMNCMTVTDEGDIAVGRTEAVYFFEPEGRGPCFGFDGEKKILSWFRGYLIVVGQDSGSKLNSFNMYDLKNKFVSYSEHKFQNITHIVSEWGAVFVFTRDGKVWQLEEKDTQTKLETLFKKNLYSVAVNLAISHQYDQSSIIEILTKYGDHLYSKRDYNGAVQQYVKTIGYLEPSYVIRKFLDAQRIHNLTSYLQKLHELGRANSDHTTLLLNCYTKLKDVEKLEQFLKADTKEANFDVETAIKVCRQASYYEHALYLAKTFQQHEWYIKIQIDLQRFQQALDYVASLPFHEAENNLKKYGKTLATNLPEQTTELLMNLCTNYTPTSSQTPTHSASSTAVGTRTSDNWDDGYDEKLRGVLPAQAVPEEYFHIFVNQPRWLQKFLVFVITRVSNPSPLIYDTLLELYLRDPSEYSQEREKEEERRERYDKALELLTDPASKYDPDHALVMCQRQEFGPGVLYLHEKLHLYHEIIQRHMESGECEEIIKACRKYGDRDPNLWIQVLSYFAGREEECQNEIAEVINNIDRGNLLPPLLVIQILARKPTATLAIIRDYIVRRLQHESRMVQEDQKEIRSYREETDRLRAEIEELRTGAKVFQLSKCSCCQIPLDLPAVHFLCMHSFHQRCLGENEKECPICSPQNKKILEIKRSLEENAYQHEQFFKQLEASPDGFSTVADYFGRGMFQGLST